MKNVHAILVVLVSVMIPLTAFPDIICQSNENHVTGYFGVNPEVTELPPLLDLPGAESAELSVVQLVWLAGLDEHRDQELTSTDYKERTQTRVDLYNKKTGNTTPGLREAEILESSNFERGQLDIAFCIPSNRHSGLLFAFYESMESIIGLQVSPFFIEPMPEQPGIQPQRFRTTTVLNEAITRMVAREFNATAAEAIQRDIELVTGVYPKRYLVESIFQREISATFKETTLDSALFHNPNAATIVAGNMLITASDLLVSAPHSVTRVEMNGINILDENNQIDLKNSFLSPPAEIEYGEIGVFLYEEGEKRPALVINKAPCGGLTIGATCDSGGIISLFCESSPLHTVVEFWENDELRLQLHNVQGNVNLDVPANYCNSDWTIRDITCFRGDIIHINKRTLGNVRELPVRQFCQKPGYAENPPP